MPEWRCFYCDEVFTDRELAAEHFGAIADTKPLCLTIREKILMPLLVETTHLMRETRLQQDRIENQESLLANHSYYCRKYTGKPSATLSDVQQKIETLEGRLLAAHARLKAIRNVLPSSKVGESRYLTEDEYVVTVGAVRDFVEYKTDVPDLTSEEKKQCLS